MTRTKYGVEFDARDHERQASSGHSYSWIVMLVLLAAAGSFIAHVVGRISRSDAAPEPAAAEEQPADSPPSVAVAPGSTGDLFDIDHIGPRPREVKNLLRRLKEVREKGDVSSQIATIESLRNLPARSIADFDDRLVTLLGELNLTWLFEQKNRQWVSEIVVKNRDTASRLAAENGSTLASLKRLNPSVDVNRLRAGMKLFVMDHPQFDLVIHKEQRFIDLRLRNKLFKRYLLPASAPAIRLEPGNDYETPANLREFFRRHDIGLTPADAAEIDLLVPGGSPLAVSPS